MALNPFSRNSVSAALDDEDRRIAERAQGYMPGQTPAPAPRRSINPTTGLDRQQAAPPRLPAESGLPSVQGGRAPAPTAPEPAPAPVNPRTAIEDLARKTRVPVNILMSLAEASGAASPEDALSAAGSAAAQIAPLLAAGQTPEQAIAAILGDTAPPETTGMILDRARQIGAEFYPDRMKPAPAPAPEDEPGMISTIAGRTGKAVIADGIGASVRGAGEILAATADAVNAPINEASRLLTGKTIFDKTPAPFKGAADGIKAWADDYFGPMISENSRQAVADSQITGDPFKPSTWDWGKNPSFAGIAYQAIDVFGGMLPIVVAAYATGGLGAAALGGSQSAGHQAMSSDDALQFMFDEVQADGTRKIDTASRIYADLRAQGLSEQEALARTKAQGARLAAIIAAPLGALGGKLTASIIDPATNILAKSGFVKRVAGRAALGAAEEGIQEVAETVGGRVGTNLGAGTDLDLTKDTLADLILGGIAGGAIGGGAGAMTRRQAPPPPPQGDPDPTLSLPPPPLVTPPPGGDLRLPPPPMPPAPPTPPAAPRGPLTTALDAAPGALMSGVKPGTPLQLDLGNGAVMNATFVAENAMGVTIRELDGTTINVPHEEIRSGAVAITQTPTPLMTIADLQALATTRLAELDAKESAGTKLSAPEQDQRSFLGNNLDNPEALADAFRVTLSEAAPVIPGATNDPAIIGATNAPSAAPYDGRPVDEAGPLAASPRLPDPQAVAGNQAIPDGNNQPVPEGYAPLAQPQPGASVDIDASERPADLTGPPAVPPASPQDTDAANTQLFLDMLNESDGAGGAPQANPLGSPPPAVQNNPPPAEPQPDAQEVADEVLTPTERSRQHREAIQALQDGKLDVFKAMGRSPRLSAVNHLLTYDKVFAKTARGFLKEMGEKRPSNDALEAFIAKSRIGNTQQGPSLLLPPTEDDAMRAWANVYLDEKAWNPFKGTFRQPSQAFRDWLASKQTPTPTPTEPAKPDQTAQDPVQPADPAPAAAGPAAPTAPTSPTGIGPEDITARVKAGMPKVSRRTLTSGNDKGMTEVTVKDGPHAGISATGTNSPDAMRELARTILQRERDGIGMTAPAPTSAPAPFEPAPLPPAPATENTDPAAASAAAALAKKTGPDVGTMTAEQAAIEAIHLIKTYPGGALTGGFYRVAGGSVSWSADQWWGKNRVKAEGKLFVHDTDSVDTWYFTTSQLRALLAKPAADQEPVKEKPQADQPVADKPAETAPTDQEKPKLNVLLREQERVKRGIAVAVVAKVNFRLLDRDGSEIDLDPLRAYFDAPLDGPAVLTFQRADMKSTDESGLPPSDPTPVLSIENEITGASTKTNLAAGPDARELLADAQRKFNLDVALTEKLAEAIARIDVIGAPAYGVITRAHMAEAISYTMGNGTGSILAATDKDSLTPDPAPTAAEPAFMAEWWGNLPKTRDAFNKIRPEASAQMAEDGKAAWADHKALIAIVDKHLGATGRLDLRSPEARAPQTTADAVRDAAAEADPNPTPAQAEANNYKQGHVTVQGMDIAIESAKGAMRRGTDATGKAWETKMPADYGRFKGTKGADGDPVDVYIGDTPDGDFVMIVDQNDLATGKFDEHKVIIGAKDQADATRIYKKGFSDGKGAARMGGTTIMTIAELKAALADPTVWQSPMAKAAPPAQSPAPDAELPAPATPRAPKLQDFGAFIGGQRKNAARKFVDGLGTQISPQGMTIADIFPIPDYEALAANGASPKALALVAILRTTLGRKPSSRSWSSQDWVEKAMFAREQARQLLDGASAPDPDDVLNRLTDKKNPTTIRLSDTNVRDFMMFSLLRPDLVGEASSRFSILYNTVLEAGVWNPVYALGKPGGYTSGTAAKLDPDHVTSLGDASYAKLAALITTRLDAERARRDADKAAKPEDGAEPDDNQKPEKPIELAVREYKRGGFSVFSMEPSPLPVSVRFDTHAAAKEYLDTNRAAIEAKVRRLRAGPNERRAENRERAGPVWRTTDATEEMYKNDLGFKGVAFGESTTAKERQARMNDTYDAMMDLAGLLNVPPKMLSLNGQLKLGFGTHGKGGKGHWAGVYMQSPGNPSVDQTIALTRKTGSGILAHEWWHAVDNFLARLDATKSNQSANLTSDKADRRHDFMSDRSRGFGVLTNDQYNAFYELRRALLGSDWKSRMTLFDQHKGKDYYATVIELAARGFERMVVDELYLRDMSNDFLANVDEGGGAYPSRTEFRRSGLSAAFEAAMTAITEVLEVKGQSGPKLPPVIEDRRYQAPSVGTTWESVSGWKEITGYEASADRFTVTDKATGVEQKVYADGLAELMDEDAFGLTEDGQIAAAEKEAARIANVVAAEKEKARFEAGKPQRDAARAARQVSRDLEAEFVAAKKLGIRDKDRLAKQYRWKNGTHSVAHQVYLQVEAGALMTKPLYDNKPEYLATPNDGGYTTKTITQTGLDYARWLIARRAAAADVAAAQAALFEAMGEDRGFKVDNPGGDWLKDKRADADAKMADARIANSASGRGLVGAVTGYFTNPIFLPTNMLAQLAGASGETREPGDPQYDALLADVQKNGFKEDQDGNAVLVGVNHKGDAFIIEGNTRVAVATALAVPSIRVEIRYFNGAETAKGALNPGKVYVASLPAGPGLVMAPRTAEQLAADQDAANAQLFLDMLNEDTEDTAAPEPAAAAPPPEMVQDALPDPALAQDPDARAITDAFLAAFRAGQRFKTILQARKLAMDTVDRILTDADFLMIEEAIELAVVLRARELVAENRADYVAVYAELMDLYSAQPILGERTPDKMRFQAYSTPAPLAYVVSRLAGVGPGTRVLEPTAGNGMLAIEATPALVQANELQVSRASQLARSLPGATRTQSDALDMNWAPFDVLLTNPPFGKLTDQATQRRKSFSLGDTSTGEIDHAIAWDALRQMPEDGRAVLILGGIKKQLVGDDRLKAYQERSKTIFFKRLYDTYNVVDHFTVSGDLYNRQGAAWPVDVILIDGRSQSQRDYPMKTAPEVLQSWVEVGRKLNDAPDVDTTERGAGVGNGDIRIPQADPDLGQLPGQTGGQDRPDGGSGDTGGPGNAPNGQPSGGSGPSAGGAGRQPGLDAPAGQRGNGDGSGGRGRPVVASGPRNDVGKPQGDRPNSENGPGRLPDPALQPVKPNPTAAQAGASAAANIKGGAADILAGIRAALGSVNPNQLNSGPAFLEDMYAALKPYFIAGVRKFAVAGQDVVAMVRAMIKGLREIGMTTEEQAAIAPYAGRFVSDVQSGKIDPFAEEYPSDEDSGPAKGETQFQITYKPRSKAAFVVGTFAPRAMLDAMNRALDKIEAEHGQIDAYVAKELGYTLKELIGDEDSPGFFSAEQIDALAMAISNVSEGKGFIIGDQTGVGKGRFVAAMLRYGARKGRIPVFVSQKPGLYADMVRDLRDIGMSDVQSKIIATNAGKPPVPISGDDDVFVMPTKKEVADLAAALYQVKLPDGREYLFTTYDQMKTVGGKWTPRSLALMSARAKIMLVLDESHTAGGSASGSNPDGPRALGQAPRNSAEFFRDLVADAAGTVFSSATYAKSPSVMSLYASTNLSLAVQDINTLGATIEKGGVPAQQIIANQLTADGQYVRREKSFDGIEFGGVEMATNPEFAVKISEAIATLADFDVNTMQAIRDGAGALAAQSGFTMIKNQSVGVQGASSNTFASVVHNLAAQFLLAVKTEAAADLAIKAWKNGEKPILTLMNVNTSIVEEAVEDLGLKVGDTMDVPFALIIERYLERLRNITLTLSNDEKVRILLTDAEIGPFAVAEFAKLRQMIMDLPLEGLSGSPVDALRNKLTAAGMKVDEITGRQRVITNGVIGARKNDAADNKRRMNGYNSGALDALILSSSGSTGFSMHATGKKGNDGKPRHMIVLQSHADINVFMQTLGRINRTGQIVLPKYSLAFSDLAIEKRAAAVLMAKMASLNANTTAGKRSATTLDVVDFINEVGDEVIKNYLASDDYLAARLGIDVDPAKAAPEDLARKVTGRFIFLPPDEVTAHYEAIELLYKDRLYQLEQEGRSPLEAKTIDLQAIPVSRTVITKGRGTGSELDQDTVLEVVSARVQGSPYSPDTVRSLIAAALDGKSASAWLGDIQTALGALMPGHMARMQETHAARVEAEKVARAAVEAAQDQTFAARTAYNEAKPRDFGYYGSGVQKARVGDRVKLADGSEGVIEREAYWRRPEGSPPGVYSGSRIFVKTDAGAEVPTRLTDLTLITASPAPVKTAAELQALAQLEAASERNEARLRKVMDDAVVGMDQSQARMNDEREKLRNTVIGIGGVTPGKVFTMKHTSPSGVVTETHAVAIAVDISKVGNNPTAQSRIRVRFALADPQREIGVPLSQLMNQSGTLEFTENSSEPFGPFKGQSGDRREDRMIVTGNLLGGIESFRTSGQVVFYTTDKGVTQPGLLMPKGFDPAAELASNDVVFKTPALAAQFVRENATVLKNGDKIVTITQDGSNFTMTIRKQGGRGTPYFQLVAIQPFLVAPREAKGDYTARIMRADLPKLLEGYTANLGTKWLADSFRDEARALNGETIAGVPAALPTARPRRPTAPAAAAQPPRPTNADFRAMTADLNAELRRAGLGLRVKVALTNGLFIENQPVDGYFTADPATRSATIAVDMNGSASAIGTMRHEIVHALRSNHLFDGEYGLFTAPEWRTLVAAARANRAMMAKAQDDYSEFTPSEQIEEVIAEQYRLWADGRDTAAPVATLFQRIKDVAEAVLNFLAGRGFTSAGGIFRAIAAGKIGDRQFDRDAAGRFARAEAPTPAIDLVATRLSEIRPGPPARLRKAGSARTPDGRIIVTDADEKTLIEQAVTQAMSTGRLLTLGMVPGRPLFRELGRKLKSAASYLRFKEEMDALRDEWHAKADDVAQGWRKITSKNGEANARLMDIMHDATLQQIDPTRPFQRRATKYHQQAVRQLPPDNPLAIAAQAMIDKDMKRKAAHDDMVSRFRALPADFQAMFIKVRDQYTDLADAFDEAILANIQKAMDINIRKAERAHADELRRINDEGLVGGERTQAVDAADAKLQSARDRLGWGAKARMLKLRAQFESNRLEGPYFPLSRFGEFFATVRDANGVVTNFSRFESVRERDRFANAERKKPDQSIEVGVISDVNLRSMVDPSFVAEIENLLGGVGMPPQVLDEIWQKWLATLPEMSVRKNRIHRKGTAGFDRDAFRSFGKHLFHGAHQLARLSFTLEMGDALEEARREAARLPDATRQGMIVKEMEARHEYTLNPTGAWWSQALTTAAFVWYLAISPAAALVNLTQTTIVGIPVMSTLNPGKGGMGQAAKQLNRALLDFTRGKGHATNSDRLTRDEKAAMAEAYRRGTIERTQSHDLASVSESGTEYSPVRTKVMAGISFFFHHTERMNREITFLASYRMAKANGAAPADAVEKAADITWRTHFDYANSSRPRIMQGDVARVALVFKNFQVNLLWRLFRDTHQLFNGETPEIRREAKKQILGITGMMMMHAGVSGTWLFGLTMSLVGLFMPGDDDPEEEVKRIIIETLGEDVGGALFYGLPGHLSGINLTDRIGMPDLWFRSSDRAMEGEDAYNYWLQQLVGAVPSIGAGMFRGAANIADGEYLRGAEQMVPKAARDLIKSYRYATEGVLTTKGDPLVEELTPYQTITQALGFTPAIIAERYAANSRLYERQGQILDDRSSVLREAATLVLEGKPLTQATLDAINAFNAANPDYPIEADTIRRSVQARQTARSRAEFGAILNPKLNDRLRAERAPLVYGDP